MAKPKRPSPFQVDHVRVRIHSGPRADGRWRWRADKADGHNGRINVWSGWATREEAGQIVRDLLAQTPADPTGELATVRDLLECWVASQQARQDVADRTRASSAEAGRRLLEHGLADVELASIDRRDLERHRDEALRSGAGGATVARDLKYLRQAWRWGTEIGEVPYRPLPRIRVERIETVYTRYTPTLDEVVQLLQGVSEPVRRGLVLLASTGCRASEITELRWSQVPLDATRIRVRGKTGERFVELHGTVAAEVRRWGRGVPDQKVVGVTGQAIRKALARRSAQIGIPKVSPNGLRRHVVDALYRTGQIDAAAAQLGHSAATALSIYRQVSSEDRRRAVEAAELGVVLTLSNSLSKYRDNAASNLDMEYSQGESNPCLCRERAVS